MQILIIFLALPDHKNVVVMFILAIFLVKEESLTPSNTKGSIILFFEAFFTLSY